ncbi:hypothetical protein MA16_Dca010672 [Dendrobium catenatum]|uniref:Uncharacterized protein n=1 Tax=Dendrobium catenatum TaxID=906689 RepID=A0A2I0VK23_9ASPA|nr:hypothetical protein MA16_Dca010672 [Dendrobium catenatum]
MAAKKIDALEERLEIEMNQIKTTVEERISFMEGQVADLRNMMKKINLQEGEDHFVFQRKELCIPKRKPPWAHGSLNNGCATGLIHGILERIPSPLENKAKLSKIGNEDSKKCVHHGQNVADSCDLAAELDV